MNSQLVIYFKQSPKPLLISTSSITKENLDSLKKAVKEDNIFSLSTEKDFLLARGSEISGILVSFKEGAENALTEEESEEYSSLDNNLPEESEQVEDNKEQEEVITIDDDSDSD